MTPAQKREKNRRYYEQNRERILAKRRENRARLKIVDPGDTEDAERELNICPKPAKAKQTTEQKKCSIPSIEFSVQQQLTSCTSYPWNTNMKPYSVTLPTKSKAEQNLKSDNVQSHTLKISWTIVTEIVLRGLFLIALTHLLILLQVEFYAANDATKYPVEMAVACELVLISLSMSQFKNKLLTVLKWVGYSLLLTYISGSLAFVTFQGVRDKLISKPTTLATKEVKSLEKQLTQANQALNVATKGRSWENMALFGKKVSDIEHQIKQSKKAKSLGVSDGELALISFILMLFLRIALLAGNSLNAYSISDLINQIRRKNVQNIFIT